MAAVSETLVSRDATMLAKLDVCTESCEIIQFDPVLGKPKFKISFGPDVMVAPARGIMPPLPSSMKVCRPIHTSPWREMQKGEIERIRF